MSKKTGEITQVDIDNSNTYDVVRDCPISLAARRIFNHENLGTTGWEDERGKEHMAVELWHSNQSPIVKRRSTYRVGPKLYAWEVNYCKANPDCQSGQTFKDLPPTALTASVRPVKIAFDDQALTVEIVE